MRSDYQGRSKEYSLDEATNYAMRIIQTFRPLTGCSVQTVNAISDKDWPTVSGAGPMGDITRIPDTGLVSNIFQGGKTFGTSLRPVSRSIDIQSLIL